MDVFQRVKPGYENVPQGEQNAFANGGEKRVNGGGASRRGGETKEIVSSTGLKARLFAVGGLFALVLLMTGLSRSTGESVCSILFCSALFILTFPYPRCFYLEFQVLVRIS